MRKIPKLSWYLIRWTIGIALFMTAGVTYSQWWPPLSRWIDTTVLSRRVTTTTDEAHHSGPAAAGVAMSNSLELTPQSRSNLGLTEEFLRPVELTSYSRSITVPAVLVPKPGRSQIIVASPLNGVVTHVHAVTGEAVMPGDLLFEVRLTYEDLVETQTLYLRTLSELAVEDREIARLEPVTRSGATSGKSLLERRYAKEILEAHLISLREALRLHGLSDRQVDAIGQEGKLLRDLKVLAPDIDRHDENEELHLSQNPLRISLVNVGINTPAESEAQKPLIIEDLQVHKGQAVMAGEKLCALSDYAQLFIEGKAFEQDIPAIANIAEQSWTVDAVFPGLSAPTTVSGLKLAFVGNSIDQNSRTVSFFVDFPNQVMRDETNSEGQRFLYWKYRLGQRLEVRVPVERWENQIVLPVEAVVKEGAEWYVFQQNGSRFQRIAVHVKHRDQSSVVIANDGSIFPGDVVALKSAHQMQMALKNLSGAALDPHAGHSH